MHISIPETKEITEPGKRSQYTVFCLHCNGVFHCAVRYSQCHEFNEAVRKKFNNHPVCAEFPPKRMLSLNSEQLSQRRKQLEKYWQQVSQDQQLSGSSLFTDFLRDGQKEVQEYCEEVEITIYLVNKKSVTMTILSTDQTDQVLEDVCKELNIEEDLTYYFNLFMVREDGKRFSIVRPLQDFECPYISLERTNNPEYKIQIRKGYWDPSDDEKLADSTVAINLVYLQAVEDVKLKHLDLTDDNKTELAALKEAGDKQGFVELCASIPGYCCYKWKNVIADYPEEDSRVEVSLGAYELRIRDKGGELHAFSVTRMRCWKISSDRPSEKDDPVLPYDDEGQESPLTLSFDYLLAKDELKWITLRSSNAIVMSMILQLVVDELIRKKRKQPLRKPSDRERKPRPQIRRRAPKADPIALTDDDAATKSTTIKDSGGDGGTKASAPKKVIVKAKKAAKTGAELAQGLADEVNESSKKDQGLGIDVVDSVKNERVFGGIGDDDL